MLATEELEFQEEFTGYVNELEKKFGVELDFKEQKRFSSDEYAIFASKELTHDNKIIAALFKTFKIHITIREQSNNSILNIKTEAIGVTNDKDCNNNQFSISINEVYYDKRYKIMTPF